MAEALRALVQEATAGRRRDDATGLDPETQAPFFDLLKQAVERIGCEFAQLYGLTETWGTVVSLPPADHLPGREDPVSFMTLIEFVASDSFLPLGGFLISVFTAYVWRTASLDEEVAIGNDGFLGSPLQKFLNFGIQFLAPVILGIIFVLTVLERFWGYNPF